MNPVRCRKTGLGPFEGAEGWVLGTELPLKSTSRSARLEARSWYRQITESRQGSIFRISAGRVERPPRLSHLCVRRPPTAPRDVCLPLPPIFCAIHMTKQLPDATFDRLNTITTASRLQKDDELFGRRARPIHVRCKVLSLGGNSDLWLWVHLVFCAAAPSDIRDTTIRERPERTSASPTF